MLKVQQWQQYEQCHITTSITVTNDNVNNGTKPATSTESMSTMTKPTNTGVNSGGTVAAKTKQNQEQSILEVLSPVVDYEVTK